jgi:hypothetical protein
LTNEGASFGIFFSSFSITSDAKDPTPVILFSAENQISYPKSDKKPTKLRAFQLSRFVDLSIVTD